MMVTSASGLPLTAPVPSLWVIARPPPVQRS
jgi:hypothetical protein